MSQFANFQLSKICEQAQDVVLKAGAFISENSGLVTADEIEVKSRNSLVSYVDKNAEEILVTGLNEIIPDAAFITEEDTILNSEGEWQWIIDPLDGTTNFLHNIPFYSISVALRYKQETVLGIVYHISEDEMFYAWKGGGTYVNGNRVKVSNKNTEDSLLATGFPYYDFRFINEYIEVLKELMIATRGLRRCGSAAIDIAYVAAGRFDVFFEYGLNSWDVAAGAFLVKEAGGLVTNFSGTDDYLFKKQIIAGNQKVHEEVRQLIAQKLDLNFL